MTIEEMGIKVAEALALQGKADSLGEKIDKAKANISANEAEISRLKSLEKVNATAIKNKADLEAELTDVKTELEARLVSLADDGVTLPIGNKKHVTTTRL